MLYTTDTLISPELVEILETKKSIEDALFARREQRQAHLTSIYSLIWWEARKRPELNDKFEEYFISKEILNSIKTEAETRFLKPGTTSEMLYFEFSFMMGDQACYSHTDKAGFVSASHRIIIPLDPGLEFIMGDPGNEESVMLNPYQMYSFDGGKPHSARNHADYKTYYLFFDLLTPLIWENLSDDEKLLLREMVRGNIKDPDKMAKLRETEFNQNVRPVIVEK